MLRVDRLAILIYHFAGGNLYPDTGQVIKRSLESLIEVLAEPTGSAAAALLFLNPAQSIVVLSLNGDSAKGIFFRPQPGICYECENILLIESQCR